MGAIYHNCINPGQLKRQVSLIKEEMDRLFNHAFADEEETVVVSRGGYLFQDISDEEMDRLFSLGGI